MDGSNAPWPRWGRALLVVLLAAGLLGGFGPAGAGADARTPAAVQVACTAPAWSPSAMYDAGAVVTHNGHQWRANHWMWPGAEPGNSGSPPWWVPWADLGACGLPSTTTSTTQPPSTTSTSTPGSTTTVPPSGNVEAFYAAAGPWAVTTGRSSAPGTPGVMLAYPTNLGANGYRHPIITWGNGTISQPNPCELTNDNGGLFTHLASWGYVVVCAETGSSGWGTEIWAAAQWLVGQNGTAGSVFSGKLDTTKIGASGGSQGATGSLNANIQANGAIKTTMPVAFVNPVFHNPSNQLPDLSRVRNPVFLVSGATDILSSQSQQTAYFNQLPTPAAKAALVNVGHDTLAREKAYATAWFKYTLEGDQFARRAFVATGGNPPQISTDADWTNWASKNLP